MKISLLLAILATACWCDIRERRIPNLLVVIGLVAAVITATIDGGLSALLESSSGFSAGLLAMLPFFALRLVGAGDVKLVGVVGGFLGPGALLQALLYTFISGGVLAVVSIVMTRSSAQALDNFRLAFTAVFARAADTPVSVRDLGLKSAGRLPYAIAIASGVVCWLLIGG